MTYQAPEVYYLHVDNDGNEHRSKVAPRGMLSLHVEILDSDETEILERTYTIDRDGKPVPPRYGLNQDSWTIDLEAPCDDDCTGWLRVRQP